MICCGSDGRPTSPPSLRGASPLLLNRSGHERGGGSGTLKDLHVPNAHHAPRELSELLVHLRVAVDVPSYLAGSSRRTPVPAIDELAASSFYN